MLLFACVRARARVCVCVCVCVWTEPVLFHTHLIIKGFVLFVCFAALRPKSTTMVMAGQSVHLNTLFPGHA